MRGSATAYRGCKHVFRKRFKQYAFLKADSSIFENSNYINPPIHVGRNEIENLPSSLTNKTLVNILQKNNHFVRKCFTGKDLFHYRKIDCPVILTHVGIIYSVLCQIKPHKYITITKTNTSKTY